jgi:hypothetical protein
MLIAGALSLCAAVVAAALGLWTLSRPRNSELADQVRRSVAPIQLAAALMLATGGVVAIAAPAQTGLLALIVCVIGAVGTVGAGSWQGARFVVQHVEAVPAECAGSCAACTLSCH